MSQAEFVHLHTHTEYSLLDGACRVDRLFERAKALNFSALAITDHGVLYGAIDFYMQAQKSGIKPIIGCEVYVAPGSRFEKKSISGGRDVYHHLVLLVENETGYHNLIRLVTAAHLEGYYYKPRIDKEILTQHKEGIIALSACLAGEIPELILKDELDKAKKTIGWYKHTFGSDHFYLELQNHHLPEQAKVNRFLVEWAKEFEIGLVATNDVHYLEQAHAHAHDALICIGTQTTLSDPKRMQYAAGQYYLRSTEEMQALFADIPEAITNTVKIADRCNLKIEFGKLHYPNFDPPKQFSRKEYLLQLIQEGLHSRYGLTAEVDGFSFKANGLENPTRLPTYQGESGTTDLADPVVKAAVQTIMDRVEMELKVIEKTGFESYFLIVGDFVRYGRSKGISCVARGSAAGSIITYLLGISNVDPIRYSLLFERFLNPERVNPPDIDIDFADDRRAEVIEYVRQKYGQDSVAQIITFGTMGAKSVVRDVGRVMGLSFGECDRLAKMVPNELKMDLTKALKQSEELKTAYDTEEVTRELIDTAFILEDLTRNASVHAAGVVIGDQSLVNLLPLKKDEEGTVVTQYAMGPVGDLGLLKMDFLGLKTLTVIRNACEMIKATRGVDVPIDNLPLDSVKTYDLLNQGNTVGVFQLESGGMRDLCRKFQISSIEHITALIALYRPGPMELIPDFIKRRHGETPIEYAHPLLERICRETYGIMVYQEQVMQAAQVLAGYTLGAADVLRRAMGKKKVEEMQKQREKFVKGCAEVNQIPADIANSIFDLLEKFAGYGFNKSHAAAYAIVAYQTAYLKANYPVEFLSAMLTNDMGDTDKLSILISEAREMGVEVLGPDINESQVAFAPAREGTAIRFGLAAIKGVGEVAVQNILKARNAGGKFPSMLDLCERTDSRTVSRKVSEALIRSGAFDSFGETRASLFANIDRVLARAASTVQDRVSGQISMFALLEEKGAPKSNNFLALPEWSQNERLTAEKELLGFYVSGHPIMPYLSVLNRYSLARIRDLSDQPNRALIRMGGLVTGIQQGVSKKTNKPYLMATLEDQDGSVQVLCMNENFEKHRQSMAPGTLVFVTGELNQSEDKPKIFPIDVYTVDEAIKKYTLLIHIRLKTGATNTQTFEKIRDLAQSFPGKCPLFLCLMRPSGEYIFIETNDRYWIAPCQQFQDAVESQLGKDAYYAKVDVTPPERPARRWERKADESQNGNGPKKQRDGNGKG